MAETFQDIPLPSTMRVLADPDRLGKLLTRCVGPAAVAAGNLPFTCTIAA